MIWTLQQAHVLVSEMQDSVRALDFHITLGGSVLYAGEADKDLDLFFLPLNGYTGEKEKLWEYLDGLFGPLRSLRDSPDYHADALLHDREACMGAYLGKRIDFFIW